MKVSSRFLLRSDQLELSQTPLALEGLGEQVEGSGDEGIGPLVSPRCLPHPVSTPSCVYPISHTSLLLHLCLSYLTEWRALYTCLYVLKYLESILYIIHYVPEIWPTLNSQTQCLPASGPLLLIVIQVAACLTSIFSMHGWLLWCLQALA